jgi:hypothetical protein
MFGYDIKPIANSRSLQIARPEKALLDLLYLYPFYNTAQEMEELRLDEDFLQDELDLRLLEDYMLKFKSSALEKRVKLFIYTYGL